MKETKTVRRTCLWLPAINLVLMACTCLPKGARDLDVGIKDRGIASWYGQDFHGSLTASGEIYDMEALTAAHRTLPLGTIVRVTNVANGQQTSVRINDRGPYVNGRVLDLSHAAARALGMVRDGISPVQVEVIGHEYMVAAGVGLSVLVSGKSTMVLLDPRAVRLYDARRASQKTREDRPFRTVSTDMLLKRRGRRIARSFMGIVRSTTDAREPF
jgi:rare lipoprotein A